MYVRDLMTSPAITVTADTRIPDLARIMRENQVSGLPIVDDAGAMLGIVTDHDLILRNAPIREPRYLTILSGYIPLSPDENRRYKEQLRHTMAVTAGQLTEGEEHPSIGPDAPIEEAFSLMLDPAVTLLPVVDADNVVLGVLTRTDLVQLIERLESAVNPAEVVQEIAAEPLLTSMLEVILYVEDMQAMVDFYRDRLGLHVETPEDVEDLSDENWVVLDTGATRLALHGGGEQRHGDDRPMIVFAITDMAATRDTLLERGVELTEPFEAAPGILVCHGRDPEGNPFSLEAYAG